MNGVNACSKYHANPERFREAMDALGRESSARGYDLNVRMAVIAVLKSGDIEAPAEDAAHSSDNGGG